MAKVTQRSNSGDITDLVDTEPPFGSFLSGKYKRSFAYKTLTDRLPVILTQIIDTLSRNKDDIANVYSSSAIQDIKQVIAAIGRLKNELVTNKLLMPSDISLDKVWHDKIAELEAREGEPQRWYNTIWLICECLMYRRIAQEFHNTIYLKSYDPFELLKREGYFKALDSIGHSSEYVMSLVNNNADNNCDTEKHLQNLIKLNLWGNRCDLSLSTGIVSSQELNQLDFLEELNSLILVDDSKQICKLLNHQEQSKANNRIIDIVLDNSGYEVFTDFCLAVFLTKKGLTKNIRFYVKQYPWFISDVTAKDFHWVIEQMTQSDNPHIKDFGEFCKSCLKNGSWTMEIESFWTEPYDFSEMKKVNPSLYNKLSEAALVIFKGDLNYRKLLGDINWEYTTSFKDALREFTPTNLLSLRTLKADLVAGLPEGRAEALQEEDSDWMITGKFGLIQSYLIASNIH